MTDISNSADTQIRTYCGFKPTDAVVLHNVCCEAEIEPVVSCVVNDMKLHGFSVEHCLSMQMVINELCTNAVYHGNRRDASKKVIVMYTVLPEKLRVAVLDEGRGYNPADVSNPTLPENVHKPSGRGLYIVAHYSDELTVIEPGNCTVVVKYAAKHCQ